MTDNARGGAKKNAKGNAKARTRRKVLNRDNDFLDTTFCTSMDWPADIYVLAKALSQKRGSSMNEIAFEAMRQYLTNCPELKGLKS